MARKASGGGAWIVIIAVVAALIQWVTANLALVGLLLAAAVVIYVLVQANRRRKQRAYVQGLLDKYKSDALVERILNSEYWKGQTEEQVVDSLGSPEAVDKQVLKTKRKEIWKYGQLRKGQFSLRLTLENGKVTSWDAKE